MTLPANAADHLPALLAAMLDQRLTDQQAAELQQLVRDDPALRQEYVRQIVTHTMLQWAIASPEGEPGSKSPNKDENAKQGDGRSNQVRPPLVAFDAMTGASYVASGHVTSGWAIAYLVATVIFAIGLAIGAVVHVSGPTQIASPFSPRTVPVPSRDSVVARITGMLDCIVNKDQCRMLNAELKTDIHHSSFIIQHSPLHLGDRLALHSGLIEITYDTGARVILQGPVSYEVESPAGGYLCFGKLTARLDSHSEVSNLKSQISNHQSEIINQKSFSVRTPTALVTDLGTEFGIEVSKQGNTTSRVFRGSVRVQPLEFHTRAAGKGRVLHENESICVDGQSGDQGVPRIILGDASAASVDFVREIAKPSIKTFDLVDVVAGGDGFSGRRGGGIDPLSGRIVNALDTLAKKAWSADGRYHRVPQRPLVDGVFVPNGENGPVQVSSAGHRFDGFLETSNQTWQYLWAGGPLTADHVPTAFGNIDYASAGHGLLYFNGDSAVTFDLEAIRRACPGFKLSAFRATTANTGPDIAQKSADIWVLLDGQMRFKRRQINSSNGVFPISIPLGPRDRFLTLATTDGGNGISGDWILFGDPRLELTAIAAPSDSPPQPENKR